MLNDYLVLEGIEAVALLAEGVDRNYEIFPGVLLVLVALLAEGVDRNDELPALLISQAGRPPRGGRG